MNVCKRVYIQVQALYTHSRLAPLRALFVYCFMC